MSLYDDLRRLSPRVTGGLVRMREESFADRHVPGKYKILAAVVAVIISKCEPCLRAYIKMAWQAGVSEAELIEFLNVAMTEGGCPAEQWALKALAVFRKLQSGEDIEEDICCR